MEIKNFAAFTLSPAILLGLVIYFREYNTRDKDVLYHVLSWQIGIWFPWVIGSKVMPWVFRKTDRAKFGVLLLFFSTVILIGIHFGWFFF